ncbi:MAG: ABC transporter ATP-binding protein [Breznakia sp.]
MEHIAIKFTNVSKIYKLENKDRKKIFAKRKSFYALRDVSFETPKGSIVGILGTNGSGKSTLSNILAGISFPDSGNMEVKGEQALISIKAGLNNQLSGYDNIQLKCALLGLKKKQIQKVIEGVIDFAELGDFLYQPVKKYSSGMKSRLGFSINIALDPDILIVDEALSVGDKAFASKCLKRMKALKKEGKTIFFISHSIQQIRSFCNTGMWIEGGKLEMLGDIEEVANAYDAYIEDFKSKSKKEQARIKKETFKERIL